MLSVGSVVRWHFVSNSNGAGLRSPVLARLPFKPASPRGRSRSGERRVNVQLICPNLRCRKFLAVPEAVRGKLVRCQHCQTMFRVPQAQAKTGAPASSTAAR